jgi:hypothetical protein
MKDRIGFLGTFVLLAGSVAAQAVQPPQPPQPPQPVQPPDWIVAGEALSAALAVQARIAPELAAVQEAAAALLADPKWVETEKLLKEKLGKFSEKLLSEKLLSEKLLSGKLAGDFAHSSLLEQEDRAREQAERMREQADRLREQAERQREQADRLYEAGTRYLDERRWEKAAEAFDRVANGKGSRADGAFYWKAYALNKQGQRDSALAALTSLREGFPNSRWLNDARALEVEIKQGTGQAVGPESQSDDELKLLALRSLMHSNPETALPVLEKFLRGNQPPKLKQQALFVLAQNPSPKSREMLAQFARGQVNPDLQLKAVEYLGTFGGKDNGQLLAEIYSSSPELEIKKRILRSFMISGDRERLFNAAKSEQNTELRREAIRQLAVMGRKRRPGAEASPAEAEELWKLYQSEASPDIRRELLNALFIQGNSERITEAARAEKDAVVRRDAIRKLGMMRSSDVLASLYAGEKEYDVKREIINGLFSAGNAKGLVEIARKETDPGLKRDVVSKLGMMKNSKEATDYMMELLSK